MANRRAFLQQTGTLALGSLLLSRAAKAAAAFGPRAAHPIGLQLYTLGDLMITDPAGTLKQLAAIGYTDLESAGSSKGNFYGFKPKELSAMIRSAGMTWRSAHVGGVSFTPEMIMKMAKNAADSAKFKVYADKMRGMPKTPNLTDDAVMLANSAAEGGVSYLICSSIPVNSLEEMKKAVDVFNKAGEACKKVGVQFGYHNHTSEFDMVEGHRPFDYILSNTDKELVKMELDLAWATKAKQDPAELFKLHPGRFPLWHAKDLDKTTMSPAECGSGVVDFKHAFDNAALSGMKYFFVEQDGAPQPIANVTNSYNYLKKLLA